MNLRRKMFSLFLLYMILSILMDKGFGVLYQYENPDDDLFVEGDINLGAVISRSTLDPSKPCGDGVSSRFIQYTQSIIWAIERVNKDPTILPNITLGYVFLNSCTRQNLALSQSTKLIRMSYCINSSCSGATSGVGRKGRAFYNIAAVVGGFQSKFMVLVAALYSQHHTNVLAIATSDELADKTRFKYYTRTWPADSNRAKAMVEILGHYDWTYIATFGSAGSYGESGLKFIHKFAKEKGYCIAYTKILHPDYTAEDYDREIINLRKVGKVRTLVMFILYFHQRGFMEAIGRLNASAEFILIVAEGFDESLAAVAKERGLNLISVQEKLGKSKEFTEHYMNMNPFNGYENNSPWYGEYVPEDLGCSWDIPEGKKDSCHNYKTYHDIPNFELRVVATSFIDQVYVVAHALNKLVRQNCPEAAVDKSLLDSCIEGELLLRYIQNSSFQGFSAYMKFDKSGQLIGQYNYLHYFPEGDNYYLKPIGVYDMNIGKAVIDTNLIRFYDKVDGKFILASDPPESVCAKPCKSAQFYIQGELACCWECRYCRENEIVRADEKGCETCPLTFWPEPMNASICEPIPPSYMLWDDPIAMGLVGLAVVSIIIVFVITYIFYKYRERKVVKGSNKELMVLIQLGLLIAYGSVFAFIAKPSLVSCYINFFGFNISCTLIFGPLFIKTNRLYRIFAAAEKCSTRVRMVDTKTVLMLSITIIFIEIGITIGVAVYEPPNAIIQMPIYTKPHVELLCTLPLLNLVIPLSFNIFLLLLCAVYGFLARKLPDNFNESWYIFISVTTTLFVWIAFLPTYFLAFYSYHKAALLALALILNGAVTCLCLYSPKIYALYFIKEENIKVSSFETSEFDKTQSTSN